MLNYLKKIKRIIRDRGIAEFVKWAINYYLLPYFEWVEIKIKGQDEYKFEDLNNGLKKYPQKILGDEDILQIIESYLSEKRDQSNQPEPYQIGGLWSKILEEVYRELKEELKRKNVDGVRLLLSDFGRNKKSVGLVLFDPAPDSFIDKIRFINFMNKNKYIWKKMTKLSEAVLGYPENIGDFFGIEKKGELIIEPAYRLSYAAHRISSLIEEERPIIVEIGPGFGGIAYHLFRKFKFNCVYICFEIPEISAITKFFLKNVFPDKKFLFYGESDLKNIDLKKYDIIIMPNYEIKNLPDNCADLVFNTNSLAEMDYSAVEVYLLQINRICKKYFLHINHESQLKYRSPSGKIKFTVDLGQPQFELPKEDFKRIYRFPGMLTDPCLQRGDYHYYEYLYEKRKESLKKMAI